MLALMLSLRKITIAILVLGPALVIGPRPSAAQPRGNAPRAHSGANAAGAGTTMPSDIDPQSGFRLPSPKRDELDETGKQTNDRGMTPAASIAGLQGPAGIQLYTKAVPQISALNKF